MDRLSSHHDNYNDDTALYFEFILYVDICGFQLMLSINYALWCHYVQSQSVIHLLESKQAPVMNIDFFQSSRAKNFGHVHIFQKRNDRKS